MRSIRLRFQFQTSGLLILIALVALGLGAWKAYWSPQRLWRRAIHQSNPAGRDHAWGAARSGKIAGLGRKASVEAVAATLEDANEETAAEAVRAYPLIEPEAAVSATKLALRLHDASPNIRRLAAASLRHVVRPDGTGRAQVVPPLIAALEDRDPGVRRQAALSLGEIGDRVGHSTADPPDEALRRRLGDGDRSVRLAAALALARGNGGDEAIPVLAEFLREHPRRDCRQPDCALGFEALMVLAARSDRAASTLIEGVYRDGEGRSEEAMAAVAGTVANDHHARVRMVARAREATKASSAEVRTCGLLVLKRIGEPIDGP
jgi:HEAT repeat protein